MSVEGLEPATNGLKVKAQDGYRVKNRAKWRVLGVKKGCLIVFYLLCL